MWVPDQFRAHALHLAANGVTEGPLFEYVVRSLTGYDDLLLHMIGLEREMLETWVAAKDRPPHIETSRLAIREIERTIADIEAGRAEVDALLRALRVRK